MENLENKKEEIKEQQPSQAEIYKQGLAKQQSQFDVERAQWEQEKATLVDALAHNVSIEKVHTDDAPKLRSAKDIAQEMNDGKDRTNLEYMKLACEYRDAYINEYGTDPAVGHGHNFSPTAADYERSQEIFDIYKECIAYAEQDPNTANEIFNDALQRRIIEVGRLNKR